MKAFTTSLNKHLNANNWWIHITVITIISGLYYLTFRNPFSGVSIYINEYKWKTFIKFTGALYLVYSPIIIYSFYRSWITQHIHSIVRHILWVSTFVIYPILFIFIEGQMPLFGVNIMAENITLIGIVLLIVDVTTQQSSIIKLPATIDQWRTRVSPEWIVVIIFFTLEIFVSQGITVHNAEPGSYRSGFWAIMQTSLLMLVYYLFYLINHFFLVNKIYKSKGLIYYFFSFLALSCIFIVPIIFLQKCLPAFRPFLQYQLGDNWIGPNRPNAF